MALNRRCILKKADQNPIIITNFIFNLQYLMIIVITWLCRALRIWNGPQPIIISSWAYGPLADNNWWRAISNPQRPPKSCYWYIIIWWIKPIFQINFFHLCILYCRNSAHHESALSSVWVSIPLLYSCN